MTLSPLSDLVAAPLVRMALTEDMGRAGDITSDALLPPGLAWDGVIVARQAGVIAGMDFARLAFAMIDPQAKFIPLIQDGKSAAKGEALAHVAGRARSLLAAERTALNFLSRLSGIATATGKLVEAAKPHKARICCTRKTTPCLRAAEKYAVRVGGGVNHRFALDDGMLIKDNHIAAVGDLCEAVRRARAAAGHMVKIEVEVDALDQLERLLAMPSGEGADAVLLDNMTPGQLTEAVRLVAGRLPTEASGGVTLETVAAIAATGVDMISSGAMTHSAPILDIALDAA